MIIINGKLISDSKDNNNEKNNDAGNIILDSGYYFGRGLFETILVRGSRPLLLKQHYNRLIRGMGTLNIQNNINEEYLIDIIHKYNIKDCVLKIVVTDKNIVMTTRQTSYKPEDYKKGFSVKVSSIKRNPYSHICYLKSTNYTDNLLEKELATKEGYDEVLFLNTLDEISEGSCSNIFFVKAGKICTPEIKCGILDGVIREWVINNFEVCEGKFAVDDLKQTDEVFLTNSIMGIMKVTCIDGVEKYNESLCFENVKDIYDKYISTEANI